MTENSDCQCPICGRLHRHLASPPSSVMEQIARDMRNGDFPKKSEQTLAEEAAVLSPEPVLWESRTFIEGNWTDWKNVGQPIDEFKAGPWRPYIESGTVEIRALGVIAVLSSRLESAHPVLTVTGKDGSAAS